MKKILIASAAIALGAVGLMAAEQAFAQRPPPGTYQTTPQGQYAFFAASQPADSKTVGIFIARRMPNAPSPELYYCSSPSDAASKAPTACKKVDAFPK
jgi:hypothetical protein